VLLCPAWKRWGTATTVKPGTVVLHSEGDDVIPIADSRELVRASGLPDSALVVVGADHRLADPEPLKAMLGACRRAWEEAVIDTLMAQTAVALHNSFDVYWPGDAEGSRDARERNLSLHFAHVLLSNGFGAYAEAPHPNPAYRGIDILGIKASEKLYIASEFKRQTGGNLDRSITDVGRVASFRLNSRLSGQRIGVEMAAIIKTCTQGVGLVAGLLWVREGGEVPKAGTLALSRCGQCVLRHGGRVAEPILVRSYDVQARTARGSYYLLYASLPI
jgi:hypothetical protein